MVKIQQKSPERNICDWKTMHHIAGFNRIWWTKLYVLIPLCSIKRNDKNYKQCKNKSKNPTNKNLITKIPPVSRLWTILPGITPGIPGLPNVLMQDPSKKLRYGQDFCSPAESRRNPGGIPIPFSMRALSSQAERFGRIIFNSFCLCHLPCLWVFLEMSMEVQWWWREWDM